MKIFKYLFLSLILLVTSCDTKLPVKMVDDPNRLLGKKTVEQLESIIYYTWRNNNVMMVVWLPHLDSQSSLSEEATKYFEQKKIGKAGQDNGLLVLIDWSNHRMRIEVGYGLESKFTDLSMKKVEQDYFIPAFSQGNLEIGLIQGLKQLSQIAKRE